MFWTKRLKLVKPSKTSIAVLALSIALALSLLFNGIQATTPDTGPYYLWVPTSTWTYNVGQFANGTYYAVKGDNWHVDYTDTDASTVLTNALVSNSTVFLKAATYYINDVGGLLLSNLANIHLIGETGAVIKYGYSGTEPQQVFELAYSQNCQFSNLIFDMGYASFGSANASLAGCAWIVKLLNTSNVSFDNVQFLNSPIDGLVTSNANHTRITNSIFNNTGEHPIYMDPNSYDLHVSNSQFYNWAKWIRGYIKLTQAHDVSFNHVYLEPNQDGLGFPDSR